MGIKFVFIDDENDLCEAYEALLNTLGFPTIAFSNQDNAKRYILENEVTACFIDFRMPEMNGDEFRNHIPKSIPCYLLTGDLELENLDGFVQKIKKPIDLEAIQLILDQLTRSSAA